MSGQTRGTSGAGYDPAPGLVAVGTHVELEMTGRSGDVERLAFEIVPDRAADFDAGFLGTGTPLARAIMGRPAGTTVPYRMADIVRVRIVSVAPSRRAADMDAADARDAATQDAVRRAKTDETIQLALTFSSKWGDYDPEPLDAAHEPAQEPESDQEDES